MLLNKCLSVVVVQQLHCNAITLSDTTKTDDGTYALGNLQKRTRRCETCHMQWWTNKTIKICFSVFRFENFLWIIQKLFIVLFVQHCIWQSSQWRVPFWMIPKRYFIRASNKSIVPQIIAIKYGRQSRIHNCATDIAISLKHSVMGHRCNTKIFPYKQFSKLYYIQECYYFGFPF